MNNLTIRKLPIFTTRTGSEHKVRMDRALADMVTASVQMKYPAVRVGKRYSIEYALMQWLFAEGLITQAPTVPVAFLGDNRDGKEDDGNHE